jgi:hypothetical protein
MINKLNIDALIGKSKMLLFSLERKRLVKVSVNTHLNVAQEQFL